MEHHRLNLREAAGGLVLVAFGIAVTIMASGYDFGTPRRMGPGFVPLITGVLIVAFGIGIILWPEASETADKPRLNLRAPFLVFAAIGAWALLLEPLGLALATASMVLISAFAHPKPNPLRVGSSLVLLPLLAVAIFVWGFRLPVSALPQGW
ncbi:MAG: tripartite tricarboxylate transporter TctB family protein [Martelella sp.]|uniref:tripartite tricarboxylate transporter TctB family protein n=1 Tax=Martelella sp. TaxID=1969699 RepID=UPI003241E58B